MTFQVPSHVRPIEDDSGIVLADMRTGTYFSLNGVGAMVWKALLAHATPADVVMRLKQEFDVPDHQAAADVEQFVSQLQRQGLIDVVGASA